jgi:hypothetical protein
VRIIIVKSLVIKGNIISILRLTPTPDIVYLGGVSLLKAIRDPSTSKWNIRDIGQYIHSDHHAFAFSPNTSLTIYAWTDGGIYRSVNDGETWKDEINEGLCITQFEFMDQHPTSDAVVVGSTHYHLTALF